MTYFADVIKLRHLKYVIKMTLQIFFSIFLKIRAGSGPALTGNSLAYYYESSQIYFTMTKFKFIICLPNEIRPLAFKIVIRK